jgi:hypothetical protein
LKYRSYDTDQSRILKSIIEVHNNGKPFDCDPCFNKGRMYGKVIHWPELPAFISFIREAYRVLDQDGLFVFKVQDIVHNRRRFFSSLFVMNVCLSIGFNLIDQILFIRKNKLTVPIQRENKGYAVHSYHSHFLVFRKKRSRTDYYVKETNTPSIVYSAEPQTLVA